MSSFAAVNPRTGEESAVRFEDATLDEVAAAVGRAVAAAPVLRAASPEGIAALLEAAAVELEARRDEIIATADAETGLGEVRLSGELVRTTVQLRAFAALVRTGRHLDVVIDPADPSALPAPRPDLRRMNVPLGPVAVFGASNFPLAFSVPGGDTASAWAAGCPVVVKGHPSHPATSALCGAALAAAVSKCGLPEGTFALVQGAAHEVGGALVESEGIEAVGFTGSTRGGRALSDLAARRPRPIPVFAEMGSVNPVFVTAAALAGRGPAIAAGLAGSATMGTGQFCTKPGLVFVDGSGGGVDQFVDALTETMAEAAPGCMLDPRLRASFGAELDELRATPGVQLWEGKPGDGALSVSYAVAVVDEAALDGGAVAVLTREHFGPVTTVVRCEGGESLVARAGALEGSLTATVHAEAHDDVAALLRDALIGKAGRLVWNGWPTGVAVTDAMVHGGPYPATTAPSTTSVGLAAIRRFLRPVAFQDVPDSRLPPALQAANPLGIERRVDGVAG
jgi:NADP-dependent aldehyde dehydrogenase